MRGLYRVITKGSLRSVHDLSEGGLAVAAAEAAFAGGLGLELDLEAVPREPLPGGLCERDDWILFSESNTRFLVEVRPDACAEFEATLSGLPFGKVGRVIAEPVVRIRGLAGKTILEESLDDLKQSWKRPLAFG